MRAFFSFLFFSSVFFTCLLLYSLPPFLVDGVAYLYWWVLVFLFQVFSFIFFPFLFLFSMPTILFYYFFRFQIFSFCFTFQKGAEDSLLDLSSTSRLFRFCFTWHNQELKVGKEWNNSRANCLSDFQSCNCQIFHHANAKA